ncbi:MAG: helix-turn-helix transcriptional regulator [Saccharofermentans sp.]|nr:helix-turn-helix transcriptional regulator [Saccharofermentans sp.]
MKQTILPDRLLSCRNNLGLTQSEAAELIGITQPAYQRYEAGVRTPSIQVTKEIAKAFNVSTAYLYGDSDQSLPDYFVINKEDNQLLFSIIEQCKGLSDKQLEEILNNIAKNINP